MAAPDLHALHQHRICCYTPGEGWPPGWVDTGMGQVSGGMGGCSRTQNMLLLPC